MNLLRSSISDHGTEMTFSPTHWGLYKVSVVSFFAIFNIFCKISLSDDKSSLVQTMAWCHQATNHYLIQYWPRSTSPYDVTRPRWARQKEDSVVKGLTIANGYQIHISKIFPEPWTDNNMRLRMWLFCSISMQISVCKQRGRLGVAQGHRYPHAYKDSFSILNFILIVWGRNRHTMKWTHE